MLWVLKRTASMWQLIWEPRTYYYVKTDGQENIKKICSKICSSLPWIRFIGPLPEKTCPQGFCQNEFQTSLLSYWDRLENWNFSCSKSRDMILSNKQITKALIRLLGCTGWSAPLFFANPGRQLFSRRGPIWTSSLFLNQNMWWVHKRTVSIRPFFLEIEMVLLGTHNMLKLICKKYQQFYAKNLWIRIIWASLN